MKVDEKYINEAVEHFRFKNITGREKGQQDASNMEFRKGIIGDYKNHFSPIDKFFFYAICGKAAKKAGYDFHVNP